MPASIGGKPIPIEPQVTTQLSDDNSAIIKTTITTQIIPKSILLGQRNMLQAQIDEIDAQLSEFPPDGGWVNENG
jgi:hypothetical protein